ncbi:NCS2 family permease [Peribacillus cavernae]|uniref:NCS2 family permease n=1 Tax=Peribacillus cavernae TaxID=1674310 RepID=A0A433HW53_9BACI|nr:NCS2 family permease [Peribacillus cavernae]MDQ0217886.1 AGZA family xanthine/uracil permease-like MFS transporter [Peribacillus cavernae]RUQ32549.1 NCS2 family permease [Peribacillus cavernae]
MNKSFLEKTFLLSESGSTVKREILAGSVSYFTIVYIVAVNSMILSEAGLPLDGAILATILLSAISCILVGFWANVPIILVPGMGINALFAYTMVGSMGLSWQSALGAVFVSGIIFLLIAFSPFSRVLNESIPASLKEAITVGLGLFLMFLGLEKGGLITRGDTSIIALGDLGDPDVIVSVLTLLVALALFIRNVQGGFLITILAGCIIALLFGMIDFSVMSFGGLEIGAYKDVFFSMSFKEIGTFEFWMAVFSMSMVLVFENIGLVQGFVNSINRPERFQKAFRATGLSVFLSGIFGSSPTVATVETAAGIASGGRTGFTSVVTGILFIMSLLFIPLIKIIPDSAIAPILIIIGMLMLEKIKHLDFSDLSESIPAILIIVMIPFTSSIADGMAVGFIVYPFLKLILGKAKQVSIVLYIIAALFLAYFVLQV